MRLQCGKKRKLGQTKLYLKVFSKCQLCGGYASEVHHIFPLGKGGVDSFKNYISLCRYCHRRKKLHRKSDDFLTELLTKKFYTELEIIGETSDEYNDVDYAKILRNYLAEKKAEKWRYDKCR